MQTRRRGRPKVLCLGMSYPEVSGNLEKHGGGSLVYQDTSFRQAVECVERGILTEMDGRDLARCVATEQACRVDVYTCSKEQAAVYRSDRHVYANFNLGSFAETLQQAFGDNLVFRQIVLDYYWIPQGWLVEKWSPSLFDTTLPNLYKLLEKRAGSIYLPFCYHCFKEVITAMEVLSQYYTVSFVRKQELEDVCLWVGTNRIDPETMQYKLGKRLDQEEFYCTFSRRDVQEFMEDGRVSKKDVLQVMGQLEDFYDLRMIRLQPLPTVGRSKGGFVGLKDPSRVLRGYRVTPKKEPRQVKKRRYKRVEPMKERVAEEEEEEKQVAEEEEQQEPVLLIPMPVPDLGVYHQLNDLLLLESLERVHLDAAQALYEIRNG